MQKKKSFGCRVKKQTHDTSVVLPLSILTSSCTRLRQSTTRDVSEGTQASLAVRARATHFSKTYSARGKGVWHWPCSAAEQICLLAL